jgi:hypothetical protein
VAALLFFQAAVGVRACEKLIKIYFRLATRCGGVCGSLFSLLLPVWQIRGELYFGEFIFHVQ